MDKGYQIACERIQGVNDNMAKSHYHEYFELYYLESGKRYHIADDTLYCLNSGEFILFPPYVMHHSYGDSDVSFKRLVLYFTREMIAVPGVTDVLSQHAWVYKSDEKNETHGLLRALLKEQEFNDNYSEEALYFILNQILILLLRNSTETAKPEKQSRITSIIHYLHENYTYPITLNEPDPFPWHDIFQDPEALSGSDKDLFTLYEQCRKNNTAPSLNQACGTEDFLYDINRSVKKRMEDMQADLVYEEGPGGHNWDFWDYHIPRILDWMLEKR